MQKVVLIREDIHDLIGIAKDYPSAIDFLIKRDWLDESDEVWVDNEDYLSQTIKEHLGENWKEVILSCGLEEFNEFFDGSFYLTIEDVYGTE